MFLVKRSKKICTQERAGNATSIGITFASQCMTWDYKSFSPAGCGDLYASVLFFIKMKRGDCILTTIKHTG